MAERKHFDDLWLSKEDLEHFRNVRALATLAEAGHPGINEEAARRYIVADMEILAQFRQKYDIPYDESVGFSLIDGMILDMEDEA